MQTTQCARPTRSQNPGDIGRRANGRIKTGLHIDGNGDPISRIGLTVQQIMGVSVDKWARGRCSRPSRWRRCWFRGRWRGLRETRERSIN